MTVFIYESEGSAQKRKRGEKMSIDNTVLIERSKKGDCSAFSQLASLYTTELYRFSLYMTGNTEDAEDAETTDALVKEVEAAAEEVIEETTDENLDNNGDVL